MKQTIKQFIASVKKAGAPLDMEYQVNAWPYPQARQSHISIYRTCWPHEESKLPNRQVIISLDNSDCPGALMRIRVGELTPKETAAALNEE